MNVPSSRTAAGTIAPVVPRISCESGLPDAVLAVRKTGTASLPVSCWNITSSSLPVEGG